MHARSETGPLLEGRQPAVSPAAYWTAGAAVAAAATLVVADVLQLASHLVEPTNRDTVDRLDWIAANPGSAEAAKAFDLLAMPFLLGTTLVYVLLSRHRSRRLAYAGGILLGTGFVGLAAVEGFETFLYTLVGDGRFDRVALADVADNGTASGAGLVMLLLFLLPALVGLLVLAVALWRSYAVPRASVVLVVAALVVDVVLNEGLGAVPHWTPHAIGLAAGAWIAWAIVRARRAVPGS